MAQTTYVDDATNIIEDTTPQLGGILDSNSNQIQWSKGADVASANALTLGTDGNYFDITGTTAITSIGTLGIGTVVTLHFDGVLILTHHATDLILPSASNITTAAGDEATFVEYDTGDWRCIVYTKADGTPLVGGAGESPAVKTSAYTAVAGDSILADTDTVAAFTITLPASASVGDTIHIYDAKGNFAVDNLTVARNGLNIRGVAADLTLDVNWSSIKLVYVDATTGWRY